MLPEEQRLTELLPMYQKNKSEMDKLKKVVDSQNGEIKDLMKKVGITEFIAGGVKATCTISERISFIEEALIAKLKSMRGVGIKDLIKKKEYVDHDALENAIYNGKVNAAELADCEDKKEVVTLKVSLSK